MERIRHFTLESRFAQAARKFLCARAGRTLEKRSLPALRAALQRPRLRRLRPRTTLAPFSPSKQARPLNKPILPTLLALLLSGCAASHADLKAAQAERERIANNFELTADGWQSLGINEEQQALYRKLAVEARKPSAKPDLAADNSLLNRLLKAVLGGQAGPAPD